MNRMGKSCSEEISSAACSTIGDMGPTPSSVQNPPSLRALLSAFCIERMFILRSSLVVI